uniref:Uncharacterized protein n=1 Tax=Leptospira santarosai serovar Arenal str. MAVJ 401 TaxID=1049976 RepID=M6JZS6_9LEPT|nr:hypothetical protein LEP1GSC063_0205 [Leptospira santarosai serovar Arenal str. MAVJ 401]
MKRDQQIGIAKDFFLPRIRQFVDRSGKRGPALGRIRPIFFFVMKLKSYRFIFDPNSNEAE